jgi:hypothetical protein
MACDCEQTTLLPTTPCIGCLAQLDFECSIYNKENNDATALTNLGLTNGATLKLFAETVDTYIGQIKAANFVLPYLRATTTINTVKQFAEAVDTRLASLGSPASGFIGNIANEPALPTDGQYWFNTTVQELRIRLNGATRKITTTLV